ncbi:MAG: YcnI family protein [Actinomycetota bacterium]
MRKTIVFAIATVITALAAPAIAHVTVQPNESTPGAFARFVVRVPNERPDASTTKVQVELPDLFFVSFVDVPGWSRSIEMRELAQPADVFGEEVTEVVGTVTWEGGEIGPGEFLEFGFSARMPEAPATLAFPALQTYDSGEVVRWIGPADSEEPAARVRVLDIGAGAEEGQLAVLGDLRSEISSLQADRSDDTLPMVLSVVAVVLGVTALAVALIKRHG